MGEIEKIDWWPVQERYQERTLCPLRIITIPDGRSRKPQSSSIVYCKNCKMRCKQHKNYYIAQRLGVWKCDTTMIYVSFRVEMNLSFLVYDKLDKKFERGSSHCIWKEIDDRVLSTRVHLAHVPRSNSFVTTEAQI